MRYIKSKINFILTTIFFFENYFYYNSNSIDEKITNKTIFTFWEPSDKLPGYISLCIKTWKKFLPDYIILILNFKKAKHYLGETIYSNIIYENMTLPIKADAIRVALLKKYGGIWMDADTIVLNREIFKIFNNHELVMMGEEKTQTQNIGFIFASKKSFIINEWYKEIIYRVKNIKQKLLTKSFFNSSEDKLPWYYLGNGIVDKLLKNSTNKTFLRLERNIMNPFPEFQYFKNSSLDKIQKYLHFYFQKREPEIILNITTDIILLHNSWTPLKYKEMSEKQFLNQDIFLSRLLSYIINK